MIMIDQYAITSSIAANACAVAAFFSRIP